MRAIARDLGEELKKLTRLEQPALYLAR